MVARVRALSYGRRAAIGPLAPAIVGPHGAPGTIVPIPLGSLIIAGFAPPFSSTGFRRARVRVLTFAPIQVGVARTRSALFPAHGTTIYAPPAGSLTLSGFVPVATTASVIVTTPTGSILLTGQVSDDGIGVAGIVVAMLQPEQRYRPPPRAYYLRPPRALLTELGIPPGTLTLVAGTPLIDASGNLMVAVLPGTLVLVAVPPDLSGLVTEIDVPVTGLGVTGLFATVAATQNMLVIPSVSVLTLLGFVPGLPPGSLSVGIPIAPMLLLAGLPMILTHRIGFHTPLRVDIFPHATTIMTLPHKTTLDIA